MTFEELSKMMATAPEEVKQRIAEAVTRLRSIPRDQWEIEIPKELDKLADISNWIER